MPIIHLKIYEQRLNDETEPKLIQDFTQVLVDNFGEGMREHTTVILEESQAEPVGRRRQGRSSQLASGRKHAYERRRSQRARIARPGRGGRRARVHRLGLHLHRGPALDEPRRRLAAVLGHARRHPPALDAGRRRRGGRAPVQQGQRPELGPRRPPAHLRALDEQPDPRRARRLAHGAGLALAGQGAQQPQRHRRAPPTARSSSPIRPTAAGPASASSASRSSTSAASTASRPTASCSCSSTTSRSPTACASRPTRRRSGSTTPTAGTCAASRSRPTAR